MSNEDDLIDPGFGDEDGLGEFGADSGGDLSDDDIEVTWESGSAPDADEDTPGRPTETAADPDAAEDLDEFPEKVRKRIERERKLKREAVATERQRAEELQAELDALRAERAASQQEWTKTQSEAIDRELEAAKEQYKAVRAEFDPDKIDEELALQERIAELQQRKREMAAGRPQQPQPPERPPAQQGPSREASRWMERNGWYGKPDYAAASAAAFAIDRQLATEGYDPNSQEHWAELDRRLRKQVRVPGSERPQRDSPVQPGRTMPTGGRRAVTLTRADQAMMRKMGYDPSNKDHARAFAREKLLLEKAG